MASVQISDLRKSFGATEILRGISVDIADGDFVTLVGPSGCGKSTLLRMIAGLEDVTSGDIRIGDEIVNDFPPKERNIAMVFQNYALYPHMRVAQNMGFSLRLSRVAKDQIQSRVSRAADILGLKRLLRRYPRELSGGQRQRVAMGRSIVRDPRVFLFDEPLSNLDAKLRVKMRAEIKELHQRLKTTTIYVTHDQIEAMTMADRIVVMRDGSIDQVGDPIELYDRPENVFVAGFIGSPAMNFIAGELTADGSFRTSGGTTFVLGQARRALGPAVLGIRPEDITCRGHSGQDGFLPISFKVRVNEPTGSEVQVVGTFDGEEIVAVLKGRSAPGPGETAGLVFDPAKVHLFDKASGKRID
jgi:multiple sugar transport system ATP-binding protein